MRLFHPAATLLAAALAASAGCSLFTDLGGLGGEGDGEGGMRSTSDGGARIGEGPRSDDAAVASDAPSPAGDAGTGTRQCELVVVTGVAGVATSMGRGGGDNGKAWTSPNSARAEDGMAAACTGLDDGQRTQWLVVKDFGLDVRDEDTLRGFVVRVRRRADYPGELEDDAVVLVRGGEPATNGKTAPNTWGTQFADVMYGGQTELWGQTWTPADVRSAEFGVAFAARGTIEAANTDALVDRITVEVHFERCVAP